MPLTAPSCWVARPWPRRSPSTTSLVAFWSEKELDHDDKLELLVGTIRGMSKIRFEIDHGDSKQLTDYGVTVIDTAVAIPAQA
jgi:Protein of unknown function (DUF4043)